MFDGVLVVWGQSISQLGSKNRLWQKCLISGYFGLALRENSSKKSFAIFSKNSVCTAESTTLLESPSHALSNGSTLDMWGDCRSRSLFQLCSENRLWQKSAKISGGFWLPLSYHVAMLPLSYHKCCHLVIMLPLSYHPCCHLVIMLPLSYHVEMLPLSYHSCCHLVIIHREIVCFAIFSKTSARTTDWTAPLESPSHALSNDSTPDMWGE